MSDEQKAANTLLNLQASNPPPPAFNFQTRIESPVSPHESHFRIQFPTGEPQTWVNTPNNIGRMRLMTWWKGFGGYQNKYNTYTNYAQAISPNDGPGEIISIMNTALQWAKRRKLGKGVASRRFAPGRTRSTLRTSLRG